MSVLIKYTKMEWCYIKVEIMENIVNSIRQCYVAQDIATTSSQVKRHSTQQTQAVDSTRELNSYYVGQVQSSDLPQQSSSDMLPNTGMKDKNFNTNGIISLFLLTAGFITLYHQPLRKMS